MTSFRELYLKIRSSYNPYKKSMERRNYFVSGMRQLSFVATVPFAWLGISPNTATTIGFIIAVIAAYCLTLGDLWVRLGGILIIVSYLFDFIDGNLARTYKQTSHYGKFLDSLTGSITYPIWILGLSIGIAVHQKETFDNWIFVAMTGSAVGFMFFESFLHTRFDYTALQLKVDRNSDGQLSIHTPLPQPSRGWRSLPSRYGFLFYQLWYPVWVILCVTNNTVTLFFVNFFACLILVLLNSGRCLLKARVELNVYRTP